MLVGNFEFIPSSGLLLTPNGPNRTICACLKVLLTTKRYHSNTVKKITAITISMRAALKDTLMVTRVSDFRRRGGGEREKEERKNLDG